MTRKSLLLGVSLLLLSLLTGCGLKTKQTMQMQTFGVATKNVGELSAQEFVTIRQGIIEMNKQLVIIDNSKTARDLKFDRPTTVTATVNRVAAAKALKSYGELLTQLATKGKTDNLQQVADSLAKNTSAALKADLSDEKEAALSKIIVGFGSFWVDRKKAKAAKEIIPLYEEPIDKLANLLTQDFSLGYDALGFLQAYETVAKRLKNASIRVVNAGDDYSLLERERAVHALVTAEQAMSHAKEVSKQATKAIANLKKSNRELVQSIRTGKTSSKDIKNYAKQIEEMVSMFQVLGG